MAAERFDSKETVLRLVFEGALIYDKETGFGTASFSLPINICCVPELDEMEVVELSGQISNSTALGKWIRLLGLKSSLD